MKRAISISGYVPVRLLAGVLVCLPAAYFVLAYGYLAWWRGSPFLWNTVIHENGRLTLVGSLFYFDHFLGCAPMVVVFALCTAGGFADAGHLPVITDLRRAALLARILLGLSAVMVIAALAASVACVGLDRTMDYALQRIERDDVMSPGGNWNQLQLSNVPIALGAIGFSGSFAAFGYGRNGVGKVNRTRGGVICIGIAIALMGALTGFTFPGLRAFLNPRWIAHSVREMATYPLTGVPIALAGVLLAEQRLSGVRAWTIKPRALSLSLIGAGVLILLGQLVYLMNADVLAMAQRPAFAGGKSLSVAYLLFSHVFEHFLDFVLIGPLTGGVYALVRGLEGGGRNNAA